MQNSRPLLSPSVFPLHKDGGKINHVAVFNKKLGNRWARIRNMKLEPRRTLGTSVMYLPLHRALETSGKSDEEEGGAGIIAGKRCVRVGGQTSAHVILTSAFTMRSKFIIKIIKYSAKQMGVLCSKMLTFIYFYFSFFFKCIFGLWKSSVRQQMLSTSWLLNRAKNKAASSIQPPLLEVGVWGLNSKTGNSCFHFKKKCTKGNTKSNGCLSSPLHLLVLPCCPPQAVQLTPRSFMPEQFQGGTRTPGFLQ